MVDRGCSQAGSLHVADTEVKIRRWPLIHRVALILCTVHGAVGDRYAWDRCLVLSIVSVRNGQGWEL